MLPATERAITDEMTNYGLSIVNRFTRVTNSKTGNAQQKHLENALAGRVHVDRRAGSAVVVGKLWGFVGRVTGPLVNNLSPSVVDPNSGTPEYKGFLVDVEKL